MLKSSTLLCTSASTFSRDNGIRRSLISLSFQEVANLNNSLSIRFSVIFSFCNGECWNRIIRASALFHLVFAEHNTRGRTTLWQPSFFFLLSLKELFLQLIRSWQFALHALITFLEVVHDSFRRQWSYTAFYTLIKSIATKLSFWCMNMKYWRVFQRREICNFRSKASFIARSTVWPFVVIGNSITRGIIFHNVMHEFLCDKEYRAMAFVREFFSWQFLWYFFESFSCLLSSWVGWHFFKVGSTFYLASIKMLRIN